MALRIALNHKTSYHYERPVSLAPQVVRLRPAPGCRTPITSYSLRVLPATHYINWQQDLQGNFLARLTFLEKVSSFEIEVDLVAEMAVINPFDFFLEPAAEYYPVTYDAQLEPDLAPYRVQETPGPLLSEWLKSVDRRHRKTVDFLVELNQRLQKEIRYVVRLEPGLQSCEQTLGLRSGSCRDSAWLLVQILRHSGLAARFVSGYLVQLAADQKSLDGPSGPAADFTDLHAWTEVYLPGAGWVGLDPTSGLLAGEGHIPLACTAEARDAAPVTGSVEPCETRFKFNMTVTRIHEDPRVTKPYTEERWQTIEALGHEIDKRLEQGNVRLTMGGEPTFVSIDDMEGEQWTTGVLGETKRRLAGNLMLKLKDRFSTGGLLHFGQGKWYPGESLPRWALSCYWRKDGQPIWRRAELIGDPTQPGRHTFAQAQQFAQALAQRLGVDGDFAVPAFEDALYYLWRERRLPINVHAGDPRLDDEEERSRLARVFEQGIGAPVGCMLPLECSVTGEEIQWASGPWPVRSEQLFLIPGDSPMGLRLPLDSLPFVDMPAYAGLSMELDPLAERDALPEYDVVRSQLAMPVLGSEAPMLREVYARRAVYQYAGGGDSSRASGPESLEHTAHQNNGNGVSAGSINGAAPAAKLVRTALCVEARGGHLHVFMPPVNRLEAFLNLATAIEDTAEALDMPVVIEGYLPPTDWRLSHIKVTPDPGVIEVNVQPAHNWDELVSITTGIYEDARQSRLGTEKFGLDGSHSGTGGGNHVVLGGATPAESPFLRRPDLLSSMVAYWNNHPALSYLFSGAFIGPTSQAPRVDEGRRDAVYELQLAMKQIPEHGHLPPWLVDRVFRHLLVDVTGNTHRAEICIDKLYSPDASSGRLGLVELRSMEMPPHSRMSLTQQLLIRALVARFWDEPYRVAPIDWGTTLHDRFLLPHFVWQDLQDIVEETRRAGIALEADWFAPHFEFRFPLVGEVAVRNVHIELRRAIEPWYVLGEEPAGGYTARYVDSSVERMQVKVRGLTDPRHVLTCNRAKVPLHPTGTQGEFVAGIRFRAWQPPSCLHPTIPVDDPLVLDLLDTWLERSLGGCRYHTGHPGGLNPSKFPVNASEAESRRGARFFRMGHTGGPLRVPPDELNKEFPMTLDLRRCKKFNT